VRTANPPDWRRRPPDRRNCGFQPSWQRPIS